MAEQIAHTKNGKIEQFGRICFYAGLLLELLIVILDKSSWINPLEGQMFRVSFLLFACKLCVTKYQKGMARRAGGRSHCGAVLSRLGSG